MKFNKSIFPTLNKHLIDSYIAIVLVFISLVFTFFANIYANDYVKMNKRIESEKLIEQVIFNQQQKKTIP